MMDRKWATERQDRLDRMMRDRQDALDARAERYLDQQRRDLFVGALVLLVSVEFGVILLLAIK